MLKAIDFYVRVAQLSFVSVPLRECTSVRQPLGSFDESAVYSIRCTFVGYKCGYSYVVTSVKNAVNVLKIKHVPLFSCYTAFFVVDALCNSVSRVCIILWRRMALCVNERTFLSHKHRVKDG